MNLCIDSQSACISYSPDSLDALIDRLEQSGYEPLVRRPPETFAQYLAHQRMTSTTRARMAMTNRRKISTGAGASFFRLRSLVTAWAGGLSCLW